MDPKTINLSNFLSLKILIISDLKNTKIAISEPKCIPVSKIKELIFEVYKLSVIIRCAEELMGRNSVIP